MQSAVQSQTSPPAEPPPARGRLWSNYRPVGPAYDEVVDASGSIRPHYRGLAAELEGLGADELQRRWETGRRFVHEQGVTYNVYDDPLGIERPWELDHLPFLISAQEWRMLEAALTQRAHVINSVLADCYGPQRLIKEGWLPPGVVLSSPDFLRPCHGIRPAGDMFLSTYAVDLARSSNGQWWVISDRTQIPTGAGYALANRLVTSRVLPEAFRDCNVHRLAGFFTEMRASLTRLASRRTDNPRVVVLTPGPYNETYFEQGYLARYLGYSLVEGQDLAVRDGRVYLKTLSGLEQVDVILRRVDDDFCDPLELRNNSMLGVPGLVEALRAGTVAVANSLGSGILQSPAFMSFLPGICRHLLGEELKIPSIASWWCGQKPAENYVLDHLDQLLVKPAYQSNANGLQPGASLSAAEREAVKARIRFQPHRYVAQERVELSSVPTWKEGKLAPRPVAIRMYLVAGEKGWHVMPGGMARIAPQDGARMISMQRGGSSKDVWVLNDGPVKDLTLLNRSADVIELRRTGNNLPSRVADNLFWLGRYAERAECTARLLRSSLTRLNSESGASAMALLEPLLQTLEAQDQLPPGATQKLMRGTAETLEAELITLILDDEKPGSLRSIAENLLRLGMLVRDRTSNDFWRGLSALEDSISKCAKAPEFLIGDAIVLINQVLLQLAALHGLANENMTRAQSWRFLDMGHRLERGIYFSSFLGKALRSPHADSPSALEAILEMADSTITYRSRYNLLPHISAIYDLVLLDELNPRSVLFQLLQLTKHFERLPGENTSLPSQAQRILIDVVARLRLTDPLELAGEPKVLSNTHLAAAVNHVSQSLPRLSDSMAVSYFVHSQISRAGTVTGGGA